MRGNVTTHASVTKSNPQYKILRCRIVTKAGGPDAGFTALLPALHVVFPGGIPMNINDKAPDLTLQDENGKAVTLKDFLGKTVVLYFYPRADTPG
jgi:hypothetical protein